MSSLLQHGRFSQGKGRCDHKTCVLADVWRESFTTNASMVAFGCFWLINLHYPFTLLKLHWWH